MDLNPFSVFAFALLLTQVKLDTDAGTYVEIDAKCEYTLIFRSHETFAFPSTSEFQYPFLAAKVHNYYLYHLRTPFPDKHRTV